MQLKSHVQTKEIDPDKIAQIEAITDSVLQTYEAAKMYAGEGMYIVPIRPGSKFMPQKEHRINYGNASRNRKIIDGWFHPTNGRFKGWNIGLATGRETGIFALDVDRHGVEDGFDTLRRFEDENGQIKAPYQKTPNNGRHYIFNWMENAASSTGKIGPGLDTRGGTEQACKGHIVVWPSTVDGEKYKWECGGTVPNIPKWITEKMGVAWRPPAASSRGQENVTADDVEKTVPLDQVRRMLSCINADDTSYDEWLRIGQAINSQHPTEEGLDAWDEWSKTGKRYKSGECHVRWNAFDPTGPVRMGSLFFYAREGGWEPDQPEDVRSGDQFDELVEEMNQKYAMVVTGGKLRVLVEHEDGGDDINAHYTLMSVRDFQNYTLNQKVWVDEKPIDKSKIWMAHEARREFRKGLGLFPEMDVPEGYYNTWSGWMYKPVPGDCGLFLDHIHKVICSGDDKLYEYVITWCADMIQEPGNPKGTALVLRGKEGTGKGTLANTLGKLFGHHYTHLIDDAHLTSQFNHHLMDTCLIFADEITWGGNKKSSGKLKGLVTEKTLTGERKGVDAITYRNRARMIVASNSEWVIPAGTDSRRWLVLDVSSEMASNRTYFDRINKQMNNGGMEALLHYLQNMPIKVNINTAPVTEALREQRELSIPTNSILHWLRSVIEQESFGGLAEEHWPERVDKNVMYKIYQEHCTDHKGRPMHIVVFFKQLYELGFKPIKQRRPGGKRIPGVVIPYASTLRDTLIDKYSMRIDDDDEEMVCDNQQAEWDN